MNLRACSSVELLSELHLRGHINTRMIPENIKQYISEHIEIWKMKKEAIINMRTEVHIRADIDIKANDDIVTNTLRQLLKDEVKQLYAPLAVLSKRPLKIYVTISNEEIGVEQLNLFEELPQE